jgi:hypothetical protein
VNLRSRRCRFSLAAVFGAALLVSGLTGGGTAAAATSSPQQRAVGSQVQALLASMSLEDKVGQLFFTYVYGDSATTENPTYTQQNQALYGVDNGAQLIAKYHAYFDEAPTFLAAYGYQPNLLTAITSTLFGVNPTGRLPVTIPVAGNPSQPLYDGAPA